MKKISTVFFILALSVCGAAQQKKATAINEIDRLCKKYYQGQIVKFTNAQGSFTAKVDITYNDEGKPAKITLSGDGGCQFDDAVNKLISVLTSEKESKGYKYSSYNMYTKGNLYFSYKILKYEKDLGGGIKWPVCDFIIENGDVKRIAGEESEKIDF